MLVKVALGGQVVTYYFSSLHSDVDRCRLFALLPTFHFSFDPYSSPSPDFGNKAVCLCLWESVLVS